MLPKEVITRRFLPHWYMPGAAHFVTYRLYGTLPQKALEELSSQKVALLKKNPAPQCTPAQHRAIVHKQLFGIYDRWLDQGGKDQWLSEPRVAAMVRSNLYHHHKSKYHLLAYCIMPNHVHVLFQPIDTAGSEPGPSQEELPPGELKDMDSPLSSIMHSLKSYTAHEANRALGRNGSFWQTESYDHWVRDEQELENIVHYIRDNPIKAGLVDQPQNWFWCSCHDRFLRDGESSAWLSLDS